MPDLELGPNDYRKQDPETGRWLQNVDRGVCRIMGFVSLGLVAVILWGAISEGPSIPAILGAAAMGFCAGGLFTLSLRRPDW